MFKARWNAKSRLINSEVSFTIISSSSLNFLSVLGQVHAVVAFLDVVVRAERCSIYDLVAGAGLAGWFAMV